MIAFNQIRFDLAWNDPKGKQRPKHLNCSGLELGLSKGKQFKGQLA